MLRGNPAAGAAGGKRFIHYRKFYIPIALAIACIVLVISGIYAAIFRSQTQRAVEAVLASELEKNEQNAVSMVDYSKMILPQMCFDLNVSRLMNFPSLNDTEFMLSYYQLNRYRMTFPAIKSIYVYNAAQGKVYVSSDMYGNFEQDILSFSDPALSEILKTRIEDYSYRPISRTVPVERVAQNNGQSTMDVFTFLYSTAPSGRYLDHNTIVINYSQSLFTKNMSSFSDPVYGAGMLLIFDREGKIVYSSSNAVRKDAALDGVFDEAAVRFLRGPDDSKTLAPCRVNGEARYVMRKAVPGLGWTIASVIPSGYVDSESGRAMRISVLIGAGIVLLGAALSVIMARIIYNGREMTKLMELANETLNGRGQLKQQLLNDLMHGWKEYEKDELTGLFGKYGVKLNTEGSFLMVVALIDHYEEYSQNCNRNERALLNRRMLDSLAGDARWSDIHVEGVDMLDGELVWLFDKHAGSTDISVLQFNDLLQSCAAKIREQFGVGLSVMVGAPMESLKMLAFVYGQLSEELFMTRLFGGYGVFAHTTGVRRENYTYPSGEERQLLDALMAGDIAGAKEAYARFVSAISAFNLSYMNLSFVHLSISIDLAIKTIQKNHCINAPAGAFVINASFDSVEVIGDMNKRFVQVFDRLKCVLDEKRLNRQNETVERIVRFIEEHYADPNLSSKMISESLQISYSTLGSLFKAYASVSLPTQILLTRLGNARKLLEETDDTIDKIAADCGFSNYIYFHKVFKKVNGVTPGEYRRRRVENA